MNRQISQDHSPSTLPAVQLFIHKSITPNKTRCLRYHPSSPGITVYQHLTTIPNSLYSPLTEFAPNAQKSRNYLYATKTPFKICEQPFFIPRPILRNLGITYRRVPVLSIGKDVFPDNASFIEALQSLLEKEGRGLPRRPDDHAFDAWGYRSFWVILPCVPAELNNDQLQNDRKDLFPVFVRKDYARLQTNAASELRALMDVVEHEFLTEGGPWIGGGDSCGLADVGALKSGRCRACLGTLPNFHVSHSLADSHDRFTQSG